MDPRPIPFSSADLERRRLESTIDQDLHSLSLATITSSSNTDTDHADEIRQHGQNAYGTLHKHHHQHHQAEDSDTSFSSVSTIEYARGVAYPPVQQQQPDLSFAHFNHSYNDDFQYRSGKPTLVGPHGTPRASRPGNQHQTQARKVSERSLMESSPVSTADHHVSAVTLADGVFARPMGSGRDRHDDAESGSEWDPDRSLGRLVGELGKVMQAVRYPHTFCDRELTNGKASLHSTNITILTHSLTPITFTIHYVSTQPKPLIHPESGRPASFTTSITRRIRFRFRVIIGFTDRQNARKHVPGPTASSEAKSFGRVEYPQYCPASSPAYTATIESNKRINQDQACRSARSTIFGTG